MTPDPVPLVVVPAYRPDARLITLLDGLAARDLTDVLVVDDGSGPAFTGVFAAAEAQGATVLRHDRNRGKGAALRTAFAHALAERPGTPVVTADADGQHTPADVREVADALTAGAGDVVLGVRSFDGPDVPLRSRVGNTVSAQAFRLATGVRLPDTQTGLRGFTPNLLPRLIAVPGDRFEYEQRVLLQAARRPDRLAQVPITTIYLERNSSSHFRPLHDSASVLGPLVAFAASGLTAFAVDAALLLALQALTGSLLVSVVGARLVSASVNYLVNRHLVFRAGRRAPVKRSAVQYAALAGLLLAASYGMLDALTGTMGVPLVAAKVVTDATLFLAAYTVQRHVVFAGEGEGRQEGQEEGAEAVEPVGVLGRPASHV
ncbi:GtrA-like protein [Promicromonospora sp. AC04]|uniref:glycosyltransferase n=1 Tax=Promicromonospora sp. AC04 TaxID=2135723 RepID=UPI000D45D795|nr:glycosyltransferase [Promicromonospora sp. AC04]PUB23503.1 GtrA-like protein [Promicromonospora sp. AC04]